MTNIYYNVVKYKIYGYITEFDINCIEYGKQ